MTDERCKDCDWMQTDNEMRRRCYSPQLRRFGYPGILINFERSDEIEEERKHDAGTGKCGPQALNFKRRTSV